MAGKIIIVGITGASGSIYGIRLLEALRELDGVESHLAISPAGARTIAAETDMSLAEVKALADQVHNHKDIGAAIASGSFLTDGMVIAPCSMKTLGEIANSIGDNIIARAADVCLKERRRLILLPRETPLHGGHIELMARVTANGAILLPPLPAFYTRPQSLDDIVNHSVGRVLDLLGIEHDRIKRWTGQA
jgi:4-hydroxy-3-polyprenylbenzoate decarboxylase